MKKVLDFLEKNVQWLAIALGAVYLLWMVYSYVLNSPVKVTGVAPEPLAPGEVDDYIKNNNGDKLAAKMSGNDSRVQFETPDFTKMLANITTPKPISDLPAVAYNSPVSPILQPGTVDSKKPGGGTVITQVTQLPKLLAATNIEQTSGRSNVFIPAPPLPGAAPGAPQQAPPAPTPGQPPAGTDIAWATVKFKIPVQPIAQEFQSCKIPANFKTSTLIIELVRQEQDAAGQWGPDKVMPALTTVAMLPWPNGQKRNDYRLYADWASQHWPEIVQPRFYEVLKGDGWHLPGEMPVNPQQPGVVDPNAKPADDTQIRPGFNPETPPKDMTTAEKQALAKYKQQKQKEAQDRARANRPQRPSGGHGPAGGDSPEGGPPRGGPRGGPGGFAPNDPGRPPGNIGHPPGNVGRPNFPPQGRPPEEGSDMGGEGFVPQQPQLNPNVQGIYPLPGPGEFDPRTWVDPKNPQANAIGDIVGWAHDATAQPGKTYRYKVRYKMKNPMYGAPNWCNPAALANEFALVSPDSQWTPAVHIPALTSFFVTSVFGESAKFEIFRWQAGETHREQFSVKPGDIIGSTAKGVDFATGYTVVDLRTDSRGESYVLLMDADGKIIRRDPRVDSNDSELKRMQQQVTQAQTGTVPVAGGGPPGGH